MEGAPRRRAVCPRFPLRTPLARPPMRFPLRNPLTCSRRVRGWYPGPERILLSAPYGAHEQPGSFLDAALDYGLVSQQKNDSDDPSAATPKRRNSKNQGRRQRVRRWAGSRSAPRIRCADGSGENARPMQVANQAERTPSATRASGLPPLPPGPLFERVDVPPAGNVVSVLATMVHKKSTNHNPFTSYASYVSLSCAHLHLEHVTLCSCNTCNTVVGALPTLSCHRAARASTTRSTSSCGFHSQTRRARSVPAESRAPSAAPPTCSSLIRLPALVRSFAPFRVPAVVRVFAPSRWPALFAPFRVRTLFAPCVPSAHESRGAAGCDGGGSDRLYPLPIHRGREAAQGTRHGPRLLAAHRRGRRRDRQRLSR